MHYNTILVHADESRHAQHRFEIATQLAHTLQAHLIGVAATAMPGSYYLPELVGESTVGLTGYLEYLREQAKSVIAQFEATAVQGQLASYESQIVADEAGAALCVYARYSDLVVVSKADPQETLPSIRRGFVEYVILNAGRPVLVLPHPVAAGTAHLPIGRRIVLAWDASVEASRAVAAALPFFKTAEAVQITMIDVSGQPAAKDRAPGAELVRYLARHQVNANVDFHPSQERVDPGDAILAAAAAFQADMIVMGCYGRSRLREVLLGGVSHTILRESSIPVLACH